MLYPICQQHTCGALINAFLDRPQAVGLKESSTASSEQQQKAGLWCRSTTASLCPTSSGVIKDHACASSLSSF
eukprot:scaffold2801_cov161-Ochromonas_danica.AAC.14